MVHISHAPLEVSEKVGEVGLGNVGRWVGNIYEKVAIAQDRELMMWKLKDYYPDQGCEHQFQLFWETWYGMRWWFKGFSLYFCRK